MCKEINGNADPIHPNISGLKNQVSVSKLQYETNYETKFIGDSAVLSNINNRLILNRNFKHL